jgi:K+-transporting ATPase KdpF subunit
MLDSWLIFWFRSDRRLRGSDVGPDLGAGPGMSVAQGILLALSVAVFIYLGVAMFKAEWF